MYGCGVDGDPECVQVGNTCTLDATDPFGSTAATRTPATPAITEDTGDGIATVMGASDLYLGEYRSGFSEFRRRPHHVRRNGLRIRAVRTFLESGDHRRLGVVQVLGRGITEWFNPSNSPEIGSTWSDPIPMLWGEPFAYSFSVYGGLENVPGDAAAADLTAQVTGWRFWEPPVDSTATAPRTGNSAARRVRRASLLLARRYRP